MIYTCIKKLYKKPLEICRNIYLQEFRCFVGRGTGIRVAEICIEIVKIFLHGV